MIEIRSARIDEAAGVLEIWERSGSEQSPSDDVASIEALIAHDGDSVLVADDGGTIVGTLVAAWDGWRGAFYRLAVLPERRRRGIASALLREGEARLRRRGAPRAVAIVLRDHPDAVGFWEDAGYELHARAGRYRKLLR